MPVDVHWKGANWVVNCCLFPTVLRNPMFIIPTLVCLSILEHPPNSQPDSQQSPCITLKCNLVGLGDFERRKYSL